MGAAQCQDAGQGTAQMPHPGPHLAEERGGHSGDLALQTAQSRQG